jgi:hypothetical protein
MWRTKQAQRADQRRSRPFLIGIALSALVLLIILTLTTRLLGPDDSNVSSANVTANDPETSTVPTTTIETRVEVISRLHQIFEIRDQAIQTRNARVLNDIYTVDCPCLKGDRALIKRLKNERLIWDGVRVALVIEEVEQVNDRLWIVNALVKTSAFEIRRESGAPVRGVSPGQERSRFALARPAGKDDWLLGQVSGLAERG